MANLKTSVFLSLRHWSQLAVMGQTEGKHTRGMLSNDNGKTQTAARETRKSRRGMRP